MAKAILNGQTIFGNVHLGEGGGASSVALDFSYGATGLYDLNPAKPFLHIDCTSSGSFMMDTASTAITNCGSNHAYLSVEKNGTEVYNKALPTSSTVTLDDFTAIDFNAGDTIEIFYGWTGSHTNCYLNFIGSMAIGGETEATKETLYDANYEIFNLTGFTTGG